MSKNPRLLSLLREIKENNKKMRELLKEQKSRKRERPAEEVDAELNLLIKEFKGLSEQVAQLTKEME